MLTILATLAVLKETPFKTSSRQVISLSVVLHLLFLSGFRFESCLETFAVVGVVKNRFFPSSLTPMQNKLGQGVLKGEVSLYR
jgi:hypothetical protein